MFKISVVIPTYNRALQVPVAVRCALEQSSPPFEVIVVDDGSTDATSEALASLMDRIRYVQTPNEGASAARNRGILEARGEWIAFLDSDDTWSPSKLQRQMECVGRTGAKVCFCVSVNDCGEALDDLAKMDPALAELGERYYPPADLRIFKYPAHPFVQSMLVERQALIDCGMFDETLRVAEDTKLIYGLVLDFGYAVLNDQLVRINRDRCVPGLSDTMDAESALVRYGCYAKVQAEIYPRLVSLDLKVAKIIKRNLLYFLSRQAEISCVLGEERMAKHYARAGLRASCGFKNFVRNILVLGAYPIIKARYKNIWIDQRIETQ